MEQSPPEPPRRRRARQCLIEAYEIADRLLGIDLPHGVAHGAHERQRRVLGLEHDPHLWHARQPRRLQLREVELTHRRRIERLVSNVPDGTDDRCVVTLATAWPPHREELPHRVLPRPQLVAEPAVHDDDPWGIGAVLRREVAAPERDAHRPEVTRTPHPPPPPEEPPRGGRAEPPRAKRHECHAAPAS